MSMPELSADALDEVLRAIKIPACPALVTDVLREAQKDDPELRVLARVIAADVSMAATAIKLANSAMFRSSVAVTSVPQAVNRIGINNVLCVVIAVALRNSGSTLPAELMQRFWTQASHLALAAAVIARRISGVSADNAYTYALFHDAAIPVLMAHFAAYAEVYAQALATHRPLVAAELEHFQCSHPIVGWLLAHNWGLPPKIAAAIRFHHEEDLFTLHDEALTPDALLLIAVTLLAANALKELGEDSGEDESALLEQAIAYLGTTDADLDEYRELVAAAIA